MNMMAVLRAQQKHRGDAFTQYRTSDAKGDLGTKREL